MKLKNFIKTLLSVIISLVIFLLILYFLPQKQTSKQREMNFVIHGAASDWEMFLIENELEDIITGELKDEIFKAISPKEKNIFQKPCKLPRGGEINDGEFVLAYKQREDVKSVCNVERRICDDGFLKGSFTQKYCKETIDFDYTKEGTINYNKDPYNEYEQPGKFASNYRGNFNSDGKINGTQTPLDYWNNNINNWKKKELENQGLQKINKKNCKTPWGEIVKDGQFTKAYKSPYGFVNLACEVELRYCIDGKLIGSNKYPICEFKEMAVEDFQFKQENEERPTVQNMIESLF